MLIRHLYHLWHDNRMYFLVGSLLLIAGIGFGYFQSDTVEELAKSMIDEIRKIADQIQQSDQSSALFWMILFNNLFSSLMMMVFGAILGFFPVYGMVANGLLLGYLMHKMTAAGLNPFVVLTVGILPHGIFELPAVVFAASLGLRYGVLTWRTIVFVWTAKGRSGLKQEWLAGVKQFPAALVVVALLLLVAALVESVVTPLLIEKTIGTKLNFMR
ncbi:MAG: stage II sporulation protein M [Clostridia bacterium]